MTSHSRWSAHMDMSLEKNNDRKKPNNFSKISFRYNLRPIHKMTSASIRVENRISKKSFLLHKQIKPNDENSWCLNSILCIWTFYYPWLRIKSSRIIIRTHRTPACSIEFHWENGSVDFCHKWFRCKLFPMKNERNENDAVSKKISFGFD